MAMVILYFLILLFYLISMKVLFIAVGDRYGSGKALLSILKQLKGEGVECFVICSNQTDLYPDLDGLGIVHSFVKQRFCIYPSSKNTKDVILFIPRLIRDYWVNLLAIRKISKIAKEYKPDIIHTNIGVYRAGLFASLRCKIPHVWHLREYETLDMAYHPIGGVEKIRSLALLPQNNIICITKGICDYLHLQGKAKVIYDGVNFSQHLDVVSKHDNFLLFVGNICQHKGCEELVDAFVTYKQSHVSSSLQLFLVGNEKSPHAVRLQKKVAELGYEGDIKFLGFSPCVDVYMRHAKAIVVPSLFECFGLVTAEAMYNKCLVIGRDTGGTKEQFDNGNKLCNGEIGLRFSNQEELVKAIESVDMDTIDKKSYVERAFFTVNNLYPESKNAESILKFYNEILNKKK